jgi:mannose-6-phosphate isomerase
VIGYPLLLRPRYDGKIWGGQRLATVLNKSLPGSGPIGESLESGNDAVVANGPLAGQRLATLAQAHPAELLGSRGRHASQPFGDFPLLVKFIDASDVLSVQVHPDDDTAAGLGKRGKTEAWHVIDAEPGAGLYTGLVDGVTAEDVRRAVQDGTIGALLDRCPVSKGDSFIVPAGTVHAIAAGVLLYEIQETSDVTFRLYDWGRVDAHGRPRESHLCAALQALVPERGATKTRSLVVDRDRAILAACRYFALERWTVDGKFPIRSTHDSFRLLSCISGRCDLRASNGDISLSSGETALIPADLTQLAVVGNAILLCAWIADLVHDVAGPLLDAGHGVDEILTLGDGTGDLQGAVMAARNSRSEKADRNTEHR